jgi:succinate dehydrogenase/fumarate reductase flavoprotein subunit
MTGSRLPMLPGLLTAVTCPVGLAGATRLGTVPTPGALAAGVVAAGAVAAGAVAAGVVAADADADAAVLVVADADALGLAAAVTLSAVLALG